MKNETHGKSHQKIYKEFTVSDNCDKPQLTAIIMGSMSIFIIVPLSSETGQTRTLSSSHPPVRNIGITCPSYCVKFASCQSRILLECKSGHRVYKFISFCLKWPFSCLFWTGSWMLVCRVSMNAAGQSAITERLVSKCSKSFPSPHRLSPVRQRCRHLL